ncbi:CHAD domain-containing protein [Fulvivirga sedimenti]|uniref:CHAD domain-containing protein n=1 Tax=Fulvivirga sedimenti TaxID=2879465 RepID=A0A9X1HN02_9BACT|nr:CHAD domain-containing protein [Fulvivirga sedimenti]MCA6074910.1 CHAD domain-containing protein [Fulvivirga sedimenti]MCA6076087.1 CHAD domain-containing protein [Fulvivirga sedimenti]MCA6077215.1 CHAD domain-containing protein [Fulvivirga sedimenti]
MESAYSFFDQLILSELTNSLQLLKTSHENVVHPVVHETRKSLKKIRGWLKAAGSHPNTKKYNQQLSSIGKEISALRDSSSAMDALQKVREKYGSLLSPAVFMPVVEYLNNRKEILSGAAIKRLSKTESRLLEFQRSYEPFYVDDPSDLLQGISKTYGAARAAFSATKTTGESEHFHEWRKRSKDLQYQCLLFPEPPVFIQDLNREISLLTTILGDDQDLYLLNNALAHLNLEDTHQDLIEDILTREHSLHHNEAITIGSKIFKDPKNIFIKELAEFYDENTSQ